MPDSTLVERVLRTEVRRTSRTKVYMVSNILCARAKSREEIRHGNETNQSAHMLKSILCYKHSTPPSRCGHSCNHALGGALQSYKCL